MSSCSHSPKFTKQSIHCIIGPHPRPRRPSPKAVTPGALNRPPKGRKTSPTGQFPRARFQANKVRSLWPKICQTIHPPHHWASFTFQEAKIPAKTPGAPIRPHKRMENNLQLDCFPMAKFYAGLVTLLRTNKISCSLVNRVFDCKISFLAISPY